MIRTDPSRGAGFQSPGLKTRGSAHRPNLETLRVSNLPLRMTGIASFVILSEAKDLYVALSCGIEGSVLPYISVHPTSFREEPVFLGGNVL